MVLAILARSGSNKVNLAARIAPEDLYQRTCVFQRKLAQRSKHRAVVGSNLKNV
jgi:hypothetical protein